MSVTSPKSEQPPRSCSDRLRIAIVSSFEAIGETGWQDLCERCADATIFQSFDWLVASWENLREAESELYILVAYDGPMLVGAVPLQTQHGPNGSCEMDFVGQGGSDYLTFICDDRYDGLTVRFIEELMTRSRRKWRVKLTDVQQTSRLGAVLSAPTRQLSRRGRQIDTMACPRLLIGNDADKINELCRKQSIRRHEKALRRRGSVSVRHLSSQQEIEKQLDVFFDQHWRRWSITPYPSRFRSGRFRHFYRDVTTRMAPRGLLVLSVVTVDDRPVAFHFGLRNDEDFLWYTPTFDPTFWREAPGELLLKESLRWAERHGFDTFDFTRGDEAYKSRFSNQVQYNLDFVIEPTALAAFMARSVERIKAIGRSTWGLAAAYRFLVRLNKEARAAGETLPARLYRSAFSAAHVSGYRWIPLRGAESSRQLRFAETDLEGLFVQAGAESGVELEARLAIAFARLGRKQRCYLLLEDEAVRGWIWRGSPLQSEDSLIDAAAQRSAVRDCWYGLEYWGRHADETASIVEALQLLADQESAPSSLILGDEARAALVDSGFDFGYFETEWQYVTRRFFCYPRGALRSV